MMAWSAIVVVDRFRAQTRKDLASILDNTTYVFDIKIFVVIWFGSIDITDEV